MSPAYRDSLGEIINCLPKINVGSMIRPGMQVISFETNRCLTSVRSPIGGTVSRINEEMVDNPADLTSETILFWISEEKDALSSV